MKHAIFNPMYETESIHTIMYLYNTSFNNYLPKIYIYFEKKNIIYELPIIVFHLYLTRTFVVSNGTTGTGVISRWIHMAP